MRKLLIGDISHYSMVWICVFPLRVDKGTSIAIRRMFLRLNAQNVQRIGDDVMGIKYH